MSSRRRRRRGEGSVFYDRTERVWVARVTAGRIRHKARAATEQGAKVELERLQRTYLAGGEPANQTLDAYLADWLAAHGPTVAPSTLRSYAMHVREHISPLLGGIIVARLRPADVRRLIADRLEAGLSPTSVRLIVTTLRIALSVAVAERAIFDNPARVRLPRIRREPIRALTPDDAAALMAAVRGDRFEPLYRLLLGSGMRLGEALGLDWRDVDTDQAFVVVRRAKRGPRAVPLSDDAAAALRELRSATKVIGPDVPVFTGPRRGLRLNGTTVSHAFHRLQARRGLRPMRVHDLRHGTATLMLAAGTPMRVIAEQLGHADPATTARIYAHVVPEAQRAAIRVVDVAIAPARTANGSRHA